MVSKGADSAEVRLKPGAEPTVAPAIEVINRRGEVSATIGCFPQMKPYARYLPGTSSYVRAKSSRESIIDGSVMADPFFSKGIQAVQSLAGIAVARVQARLSAASSESFSTNSLTLQRTDLLARLMQGKDDDGKPLGRDELTAEALTQLIAGSDTTSNTSCALLYHVLSRPGCIEKVQAELDLALPRGCAVPTFEMVKGLPFYTFPPGTVLSVPTYTLHHSPTIWGADADEFIPERWSPSSLTERQKGAFIPFSTGPRACVGRNVAEMELALIAATVLGNYEFEVVTGCGDGREEWVVREGFLRKPVGLSVRVRRRRRRMTGEGEVEV
ncbi:hypothetical protein MRB53_042023 [Persea americana]|nr:hypothetical protein MRB53_042023 [Persea americana]